MKGDIKNMDRCKTIGNESLREINQKTRNEIEAARKKREARMKNNKIMVYETDVNVHLGYGGKELTRKQEMDFQNIKETIEKSASETLDSNLISLLLRNRAIVILICIAVITVVTLTVISTRDNTSIITTTSNIGAAKANTVINVSMNESNQLVYSIDSAMIKSSSKLICLKDIGWLNEDISTEIGEYSIEGTNYKISNEMQLKCLDLTTDSLYVQYRNAEDTASKELIMSNKKPEEVQVDNLQKRDSRTFEKTGPLGIRIYRNSYDGIFLMLSEQLSGGKLHDKSLEDTMNKIEGAIATSNITVRTDAEVKGFDKNGNTTEVSDSGNIKIKLNNLGEINLGRIAETSNAQEIIYDESNVLRIRNKEEKQDYVYICGIGNEVIKCSAEDLIATTTDNVFIHKDFNEDEAAGHNIFAIKTSNDLFIFKVNDSIDNEKSNTIMQNILGQLGINECNFTIKKVQTVVPKSTDNKNL